MKYLPLFPILTRYPFLKVGGAVFKDVNLETELRKNPDVKRVAKDIVLSSIEGKFHPRDYDESDIFCKDCDEECANCNFVTNYESCDLCLKCFENCKLHYPIDASARLLNSAKLSVLTYILSKIIVSSFDDWVRMRFAVNESQYYRNILSRDGEYVVKFVAKDLGIKLKNWNVHVSDYVRVSSRIKDEKWKLVNRTIRNGYVESSRREIERIIQEMLRIKLFRKIQNTTLEKLISNELEEIKRRVRRESKKMRLELKSSKVELRCFPPCMKEILAELQKGMNVPHSARFALTSFLLNIGMGPEEVIRLFKTAPDFDEERTRYQVEHIAGKRGRRVEYSPPSCDTMRTYQNCIADCKVSHPLIYYAKCIKRR
ncbi:MAG TPA: DNA primase regulatory subunit PriL [Archaeoglobus sp.]|nr:DNA primase regulatory subunit PriL [Archaeoglobus sp.]